MGVLNAISQFFRKHVSKLEFIKLLTVKVLRLVFVVLAENTVINFAQQHNIPGQVQ